MDRDQLHQQFYSWLVEDYPDLYANPQNALIIPFDTTRVVIDSEPLDDGRLAVSIRAAILMDLDPTPELVTHVATHANAFRFGNLYFFEVAEGAYDLDFAVKVMHTWMTVPGLVELAELAGQSAVATAAELRPRFGGRLPNPSGKVRNKTFIGTESQGRQDVWEGLNGALETQRCLVLGTAERIELSRVGAAVEGWFVVNSDYLWFAGRNERTRQLVLWRIPHGDVVGDDATPAGRAGQYRAQLRNGNVLTVTTASPDAAPAILEAHRDPRDPNLPT